MKKIGGFFKAVGNGIRMITGIAIMLGGIFSGIVATFTLFEKLVLPTVQESFFDD